MGDCVDRTKSKQDIKTWRGIRGFSYIKYLWRNDASRRLANEKGLGLKVNEIYRLGQMIQMSPALSHLR